MIYEDYPIQPHIVGKINYLVGFIEDVDHSIIKDFLESQYKREDRFFAMDAKDGDINAFMFATIEEFDGRESVFIQVCVNNGLGDVPKMLDACMEWGRKKGLRDVYFMTKRDSKGFERKYKFEERYKVLHRGIT